MYCQVLTLTLKEMYGYRKESSYFNLKRLRRYYLQFQALEIYVFDDADPEPAVYLGLAKVPLIPLANDKTIKGTFELRRVGEKISL